AKLARPLQCRLGLHPAMLAGKLPDNPEPARGNLIGAIQNLPQPRILRRPVTAERLTIENINRIARLHTILQILRNRPQMPARPWNDKMISAPENIDADHIRQRQQRHVPDPAERRGMDGPPMFWLQSHRRAARAV